MKINGVIYCDYKPLKYLEPGNDKVIVHLGTEYGQGKFDMCIKRLKSQSKY